MSLSWPYADPHLTAAYMMNAAAATVGSYPFAPLASPLSYYEMAWRAALNSSNGPKIHPYRYTVLYTKNTVLHIRTI